MTTINKSAIQAVLFDLDGTLVDTARDFVYIIQQIGEKHGLKIPSNALICEQVSAGVNAMVSVFQTFDDNQLSDEKVLEYCQEFWDNYEQNICVKSQVYEGLEPFLTQLESQGIAWGVVTNKPRYFSERLLQALHLDKRCGVLVCPEDVTNAKPDPEPLFLALDTLNIAHNQANNVLYIGDHIRDIQAGNSAGMKTIVAGYGYISEEDKHTLDCWDANDIANSSQALVEIVSQYINKE